ncbi:alpha-L-fucosidase [Opitutaceae bacterium TAV5]|nr:alpha-L-fucosidase [Opitutaceae bacterium TAV5]
MPDALPDPFTSLWFDQPAQQDWNRALPIGNGRFGAMIYGNIVAERLQLNEDSLWNGGPRDRRNPDAREHLPVLRQLLADGRLAAAHDLVHDALAGIPDSQRCYEPLADLFLHFEHPGAPVAVSADEMALASGYATPRFDPALLSHYRRALDLRTAVMSVDYTLNNTSYARRHLASTVDQVIALHLRAGRPGGLTLRLRLERGPRESYSTRYADTVGFVADAAREPADARTSPALLLRGRAGGEDGVRFAVGLRARIAGGALRRIGETLCIDAADSVTLVLAAATTFREDDPAAFVIGRTGAALARGWDKIRADHEREYRSRFDRASLTLGAPAAAEAGAGSIPVDLRLKRARESGGDPVLASLYFNYARYLLISSSRPGSLPANLQGLWNADFWPSWGSKYTININTEMNYWIAEPANLADCHQPLFDHLGRVVESGRETARVMYGCRGFVAHHNTDLWADTCPTDRNAGASYWTIGGAWLVLHAWDRFDYDRDPGSLAAAYALLREASLFFLDFLIEDARGRLVLSPTCSPENTYRLPNGEAGVLCAGCTMDSQLLSILFRRTAQAAQLLGRRPLAAAAIAGDHDFLARVAAAAARLPQPAVGRHGQLLEWLEDYEELDPQHRHVSHAFGLHPGDLISPRRTPDLARAIRVTLERRGDAGTGWCMAWKACMWARLGDGERAHRLLGNLLAPVETVSLANRDTAYEDGGTYPNLFCAHPPFQIDGNFGGAAAILEMLLQSHETEPDADAPDAPLGLPVIHLLPALPSAWPAGSFRGFRARGGCEVDLQWEAATPVHVALRASTATSVCVRHGDVLKKLRLQPGAETVLAGPGLELRAES